MREIDPFSFFIDHASAISGLGGDRQSPDPSYCFHTPYIEVRPGPAHYELRLKGVRASLGELALRVHAFRPDSGENASLVAGARLDISTDQPQDLSTEVRFVALRDVQYAFYGYFLEASDLHADDLSVIVHENEGEVEEYIEPPRSVLALDHVNKEVRPANALIYAAAPRLMSPVSQGCTIAQCNELETSKEHVKALTLPAAEIADWGEAVCLAALRTYGLLLPALEGLVVGDHSAAFLQCLMESGFLVRCEDIAPLPSASSSLFGDFVVSPELRAIGDDSADFWTVVRAWLGRLKIGGLGALVFRYAPSHLPSASERPSYQCHITPNEIGRWALRLIGDGYSVAPLAFPPPDSLVLDDLGLARFVLIVQRR